ncbi:MAG: hypothetical protein COA79_06775 [Planctomycetota bacterium]|nr:MAG: hypothetical protein COA79_06775 [Planctomycetota bacterium]
MNLQYWANQLESEGEKKPLEVLRKILKHKDGEKILTALITKEYSISAKRWSVEGLGYFNSKSSVNLTLQALTNDSMTIKLHAIHALSIRGNISQIKKIRPLLKDQWGGIRLNALTTLLDFKIKLTKSEIKLLKNDDKNYIRKK